MNKKKEYIIPHILFLFLCSITMDTSSKDPGAQHELSSYVDTLDQPEFKEVPESIDAPNAPTKNDLTDLQNNDENQTEQSENNNSHIIDSDSAKITHIFEEEEELENTLPLELRPSEEMPPPIKEAEPNVELNLENTDLKILVGQMESIFNITCLTDDIVDPMAPGGKALKGHKIIYKPTKPLTKQEAWNLFITFLDLSGFALTPDGQERTYRIKSIEQAQKSPLSIYVNIDPEKLPESNERIRYIYFLRNSNLKSLEPMIKAFQSPGSSYAGLADLKSFVLTDKAYNIKTTMRIVRTLDKTAESQAMTVIKLRQADAKEVAKLYESLLKTDDPGYGPRSLTQKKQPTATYFPENVTIFAEERSNVLIVLGPEEAIKRVEQFVTKYVDVELDQPYSPLFVYQVHYASAKNVADIMQQITNAATPKGKEGGVRAGDKFLKPMTFTAEPETNQVIVKGDYNDYIRAKEIMDSLDEPQPQIAIEVLLVSVDTNKSKELGTQVRTKIPGPDGLIGTNVNFQTSGIRYGRATGSSIIPKIGESADSGSKRLLGNLLNTVLNPSLAAAGSTVINLGSDACGVWGIFNILESVSNVEVISNPFLVATNKTKASVESGETRRVITSTVASDSGQNNLTGRGDFTANLTLTITPQINSDGMIVLEITINNDEFTSTDPNSPAKTTRTIDTKTILADKEVLAIGGLIQNKLNSVVSKVPILGDIPVFGWLFKNKSKRYQKSNVLALISVRIIQPNTGTEYNDFTKKHMNAYYDSLNYMRSGSGQKDPVNRLFFDDKRHSTDRVVEDLIFERTNTPIPRDADKKRQLVAREKRSRWKNKRGRRKRRHADERASQISPPEQPMPTESFESITQKSTSDLLVHNKPRKKSSRRSLFDTLLENQEDHA